LTVRQWNVMSWAFPLYILVINLTFVTLILLPKRLRYQRSAAGLAWSAPTAGERLSDSAMLSVNPRMRRRA
jgi:hypothetical protein